MCVCLKERGEVGVGVEILRPRKPQADPRGKLVGFEGFAIYLKAPA